MLLVLILARAEEEGGGRPRSPPPQDKEPAWPGQHLPLPDTPAYTTRPLPSPIRETIPSEKEDFHWGGSDNGGCCGEGGIEMGPYMGI